MCLRLASMDLGFCKRDMTCLIHLLNFMALMCDRLISRPEVTEALVHRYPQGSLGFQQPRKNWFFPLFQDRKEQRPGLESITFLSRSKAERSPMAWSEQNDRSLSEDRAQPGRKNQKEYGTIFNSSSQTKGRGKSSSLQS